MRSRMRRPETVRIDISDGDYLIVKKHLTAGEQRGMFARMIRDERDTVNPLKVGMSQILAYLLDWSLIDLDGKPVKIADQPESAVQAALDAIDVESFDEILTAIKQHEAAMKAEREKEKKQRDGGHESSAISPSVGL